MSRIEIIEVTGKKLMKQFVNFVLDLYKGCPHYVPYMYGDELKMLDPKFNLTLKDCDARFYLCKKDGALAGRIGAVLQRKYNALTGKKNVRFMRFDCVDDLGVAKALLDTVESFAVSYGMTTVMGPYGFNETDRAGYLSEGFDLDANFGTNYNYPYYDALLRQCGYGDSSEWLELHCRPKEEACQKYAKLSEFMLKKSGFTISDEKTFPKFAKKYGWKAFQCLNAAYAGLPGFIPFEKDLYDQIIGQFSIAVRTRYMTAVIDKNNDVAGFAVCFPSLTDAMKKTRGKLFPFGFIRILRAIAKPKVLDLCLIGVRPEYHNTGVNLTLIAHVLKTIKDENITLTEAYPELIENTKTLSQWEHFDTKIVKHRKVVEKTL
ncbi:MAG: hypothetical protein LBS99_01030 [Clostridiales bacterium]|jgi:GNAT superfamily N-acetyltransferase|nr:hypothetical protein [Clostridiales bacterium]